MSIFKGKRYRKCVQEDSGEVSCVAYKPQRDGKKIPTATIRATLTPDCLVGISESDGDQNDIEELEEYLSKSTKVKCKKNQI